MFEETQLEGLRNSEQGSCKGRGLRSIELIEGERVRMWGGGCNYPRGDAKRPVKIECQRFSDVDGQCFREAKKENHSGARGGGGGGSRGS